MNKIKGSSKDLDYILSPQAVRERSNALVEKIKNGKGQFVIHEEKLESVVDLVIAVTNEKYPDGKIPFHSRRGHFQVGKVDRLKQLKEKCKFNGIEWAKAQFDLTITSVLLDAGSGPTWKYQENGETFSRSEGLAVASYHMFEKCCFGKSQKGHPTASSEGLRNLTESDLIDAFQVSSSNPLVGVEGRLNLLNQLSERVEQTELFFPGKTLGGLVSYLTTQFGMNIHASDILKSVLKAFGPIWPSRLEMNGVGLGDCWSHELLGDSHTADGLIPFHKLSQWLTYSLLEPLLECGVTIVGISDMTGLPEYRNGGLLIDSGLIELKDHKEYENQHLVSAPIIVEWRALTIVYLDKIAKRLREKLKKTEEELPLVKVLEGGTWWAGRILAAEKRSDKSPPLKIISDGTVF